MPRGKLYEGTVAGEDYYTVLHSMVGLPAEATDDPKASVNIDAKFVLKGDVVAASLFGAGVARLVKLGAIRPATAEERGGDLRTEPRRAQVEDDAEAAAASTVADTSTLNNED